MLSYEDIMYIEKHGWIIDHDWEIFSCLLGEPILLSPFLCYWNGSQVAICSWPVEKSFLSSDLSKLLLQTLEKCAESFAPNILDIWGPSALSLSTKMSHAYRRYSVKLAAHYNVNLQIRFNDYIMNKSRKNRSFPNSIRAEKEGLHCKIVKSCEFNWEQFSILENLIINKNLSTLDKTYASLAPILASSKNSTVFQAYKENESYGFIIVRELLKNVASIAWSGYKRSSFHTSDFLYRKVIEHYQNSGIPVLDMGYTVNKGLMEYKARWNPNINNGSYYNFVFVRNSYQFTNRYWCWWANQLFS